MKLPNRKKLAVKKKSTKEKPEYPKVLEQFGSPYLMGVGLQQEPSCLNGKIHIRRYRITVEEIDEPVEVLRERVLKLWHTCDNHHHWDPLKKAAEALGLKLDPKEFGKDFRNPSGVHQINSPDAPQAPSSLPAAVRRRRHVRHALQSLRQLGPKTEAVHGANGS